MKQSYLFQCCCFIYIIYIIKCLVLSFASLAPLCLQFACYIYTSADFIFFRIKDAATLCNKPAITQSNLSFKPGKERCVSFVGYLRFKKKLKIAWRHINDPVAHVIARIWLNINMFGKH